MQPPPAENVTEGGVFAEMYARIKISIWWKCTGIPAFNAVFFVGYFLILRNPKFGVTEMPLTVVDDLVPYQFWNWFLYVSLWLYVQLPPSLTKNKAELFAYGWTAGAVSLVGFVAFVFWPTAVPSGLALVDSAFERVRAMDTTGNSCPSLHVAFSIFSMLWLDRLIRQRGGSRWVRVFNVLWALGIVYSTMGTKQHVSLDVLAGAVLGVAGAKMQETLEARLACKGRSKQSGGSEAIVTEAGRVAVRVPEDDMV